MDLAARGHDVWVMDNYLRRNLARQTRSEALVEAPNLYDRSERFAALSGRRIRVFIGDCANYAHMERLFTESQPDAVVHYAEQPSAPYSMIGRDEAELTLRNNLASTFNVIWAVMQFAPGCHIVKLGTMGEYGTPNIDIEEGWLEVEHKGRREKFLYPRAAGSLYHTTKICDTDLLWFYVRTYGLRVTDLMQGPVYGLLTPESQLHSDLLPNFHYDDIFGTVVNRFIVQAVAGVPLTVYGKGGQVRGYLNLLDTLQCVRLALGSPPPAGDLRVLNQFTQTFSVNELAAFVVRAAKSIGIEATVEHVSNPRMELEEHYYNPACTGFAELGLQPTLLSDDVLAAMLGLVREHAGAIDRSKIAPRVRWNAHRDAAPSQVAPLAAVKP